MFSLFYGKFSLCNFVNFKFRFCFCFFFVLFFVFEWWEGLAMQMCQRLTLLGAILII